jgi:uncharacterized protein (DUF2141 family)
MCWKKVLLPFLIFFASAAPTCRQPMAAGDPPTTLTIRIADVRDNKGDLIFGVFSSAPGFPSEKSKSVNWQVKPAGANVVFTASLPPGKYAASVLHDENRNGKMDRDALGVPLEGYGVTNNPKPAFRAARFDEATFQLPPAGATLTISVQYFR